MKLSREKFEQIVEEGIKAIPEKFLEKLSNVAIVIEDEPKSGRKNKSVLLLGLYEGVPQLRRGVNYSAVLPDKITIFKKPIESLARSEEEIKKIVRDTVWHEIAHHFGMDEHRVRRAESSRRKKP